MNQPISMDHVRSLLAKNGIRARVIHGEVKGDKDTIFLLPGEPIGHFVCVFKNREGLNFFDPYGGSRPGYVSDEHAYQGDTYYGSGDQTINTCGRHCVNRLKFKTLTRREYRDMMGSNADLKVQLYV